MESLSMETTKSENQKHPSQKGKYCAYKATQKDNLQQHVKTIHDGVKYSCD